MMAMAWYQYVLNRRLKALEYRLQTDNIANQKALEFISERHVKRVDALDQLNALMMHFDHDVMHVAHGDVIYKEVLQDNYAKARTFARDSESLLGRALYDIVLDCTDRGREILKASYCVTQRTIQILETRELASDEVGAVSGLLGRCFAIAEADDLSISGISSRTLHMVFQLASVSEEFDEEGYSIARARFEQLKAELLRTLPKIPETYRGAA
jgi:hypothetical protein